MGVEVRLDSLVQSQGGAITGRISVRHGSLRFPEAEWNDFVVIVLDWWCESCSALLRGAEQREFWFMDGPFCFRAQPMSDDAWSIQFLQLRSAVDRSAVVNDVVPTTPNGLMIRPLPFVHSLVTSADAVLDACRQRGWSSPETESLQRRSRALRSLLER